MKRGGDLAWPVTPAVRGPSSQTEPPVLSGRSFCGGMSGTGQKGRVIQSLVSHPGPVTLPGTSFFQLI